MPAVPKTSDAQVVRAARKLLERHGVDQLSMLAVAEAVGVRAPSLYKRFPDRAALLRRVADAAVAELGALLADADRVTTAAAALAAMARAYRGFARRVPRVYPLLFADAHAQLGPSVEARAAAVAPLLARLVSLVGARDALPAARLLTAWLHGFVSMELAGAFQLGGDVDQAFDYGLTTILRALSRRPAGRRRS